MITSVSNPKVKQVVQWRKKSGERRRDRVFLAEGVKMFEEAPEKLIREVFLSEALESKLQKEDRIWRKLCAAGYETVSEEVFSRLSDTMTPQGILTVLKQPEYGLKELLEVPNPLFLVMEDLQDPGNLGTIIRTGEGAGVTGVIICGQTVDIFNPKVIRATMGSIYRVPFLILDSAEEAVMSLRQAGVRVCAAHLKGERFYDGVSYLEPTAFLIGNEGNGLKEHTAGLADIFVKIPMEGKVESLNAAVAAALLMYEARRQRR